MNADPQGRIKCKLIHVSGFIDFLNPAIQDLIGPSDLIIFQRNIVHQEVYDAIQYWQAMGKPVVVDLDDAYHILPWSNPAHKFWHEKFDGEMVGNLEKGLQLSDGLVAPNRLLLNDWKHVARGYYLPNFAEAKWWLEAKSHSEMKEKLGFKDDHIIIGWGGSVSHLDSWYGSGIIEAAKRVTERHKNVRWMICGNDPRITKALPFSKRRKFHQIGVPPSEWPSVVKTFDIGVAPLFGPYDQRRSWIKGLEYMLAGTPWIGTVGEPYADLEGYGVIIENSVDNWEEALEMLVSDIKNERERAAGLVEVAQQWFASNQIETYQRVFKAIIDGRNANRGALPGVYYVEAESGQEPVVSRIAG